jgi:hypothetical protein
MHYVVRLFSFPFAFAFEKEVSRWNSQHTLNKLFLVLPSLLTFTFFLLELGAAPFNSTSADFDIPFHWIPAIGGC